MPRLCYLALFSTSSLLEIRFWVRHVQLLEWLRASAKKRYTFSVAYVTFIVFLMEMVPFAVVNPVPLFVCSYHIGSAETTTPSLLGELLPIVEAQLKQKTASRRSVNGECALGAHALEHRMQVNVHVNQQIGGGESTAFSAVCCWYRCAASTDTWVLV